MTIQFQKATRHAVRLKVGIDGASGSGKTLGALALARGITRGGRIALADSENGSASLYAGRFDFDTLSIPDAKPETYMAIIDAAVTEKYDALVIDSLSHAWFWVLAKKEDHDRANPKSNQWTNWRIFGPKWDNLMQHILQAPIHIIATMRSKQAYEQVENAGRKQVVKLGLQPQVRDGSEYEFGLVFSVNQAHRAEATKDRTELFAERLVDLCDATLHAELVAWMNAGGPLAIVEEREPVDPTTTGRAENGSTATATSPNSPTTTRNIADENRLMGGKRLGDYSTEDLNEVIRRKKNDPTLKTLVDACRRITADRALGCDDESTMKRIDAELEKEDAALPF